MATYTYSIGEKIEIEIDGKKFDGLVTDVGGGKIVVRIKDKKAGDLNGAYLKLGRES